MKNRLAKHKKSFKLKQGLINSFLQFFSQDLELCTNNGSFVKKAKYFRHKLVVSLTNENQILPLRKTTQQVIVIFGKMKKNIPTCY